MKIEELNLKLIDLDTRVKRIESISWGIIIVIGGQFGLKVLPQVTALIRALW